MDARHSYRQHLSAGVLGQPRACLFVSLSLSLSLSLSVNVCVCVCACVHVYTSIQGLSLFPQHPHTSPPAVPSFAPSRLSVCLTSYRPSYHHPLDLSLPLSLSLPHSLFSAPVTEKQTRSVFLCCLPAHYSPQAATPSQRKGRDKLQEYTCAWYECQIQSQ